MISNVIGFLDIFEKVPFKMIFVYMPLREIDPHLKGGTHSGELSQGYHKVSLHSHVTLLEGARANEQNDCMTGSLLKPSSFSVGIKRLL